MTDTLDAIAREKFAHTLSRMLLRRERTGAVTERGQRFVKAERDALQAAITALSNQGEGERIEGNCVVIDSGFTYENGIHTPTVLVGFAPDDWAARDRFVSAIKSPAEADRRDAERLAAAVGLLREVSEWIGNWSPNFADDPEWQEVADRIDAATQEKT